jgi:FixJ family two-component response regulator
VNTEAIGHKPTDVDVVHIIDDDESTRRALTRLMRSAGLQGRAYASVTEFRQSNFQTTGGCIVADVHMAGDNSLLLPEQLREIGVNMAVIFITADYSAETRERIRKAGGRGYFAKPVDDQALIDMIRWALRSPE